jgi:putative RNA 2'-phosphotransferase
MNAKETITRSKFLSLILRHEPERVGLELDGAGWVGVDELLAAMDRHGNPLTRDELKELVVKSDKQRFAFSPDGLRIRANQGHSIEVDLQYAPEVPPEFMFHGTPEQFLESIRKTGLNKGQRHHVHLSTDPATAAKVAQRRGRPIVLKVRAGEMHRSGFTFFRTANGVWLVDHVPNSFLEVQP